MRTEKVSEPNAPQRVTLLYRGARLGAELLALLGEERLVNVISSPAELAKDGPPADMVVVDIPQQDRRTVYEQVRRRYHGPLIVLLNPGDNSRDLPPDHSRVLLTRPFSMRDLSVALAGSRPTQPTLDPIGHLRLVVPPHGGQDRGRPERAVPAVPPAVPRPVRSWRDRRMLRIAVIAIAAALAFTGAFALVNRSNGCGPGCHELAGADLTSPSNTTFQAVPMGPDTSDSGAGTVASTTTDSSAGPVANGGLLTDAASGAAQITPATAGRSAAPSPTAPPDPTRPQTSAPPSTAPKTTTTRASTTTTTTSTTTTTTTTTTTPTEP